MCASDTDIMVLVGKVQDKMLQPTPLSSRKWMDNAQSSCPLPSFQAEIGLCNNLSEATPKQQLQQHLPCKNRHMTVQTIRNRLREGVTRIVLF